MTEMTGGLGPDAAIDAVRMEARGSAYDVVHGLIDAAQKLNTDVIPTLDRLQRHLTPASERRRRDRVVDRSRSSDQSARRWAHLHGIAILNSMHHRASGVAFHFFRIA